MRSDYFNESFNLLKFVNDVIYFLNFYKILFTDLFQGLAEYTVLLVFSFKICKLEIFINKKKNLLKITF